MIKTNAVQDIEYTQLLSYTGDPPLECQNSTITLFSSVLFLIIIFSGYSAFLLSNTQNKCTIEHSKSLPPEINLGTDLESSYPN